jgi:F0F1-type ATP synthase membrane subunit b/b'
MAVGLAGDIIGSELDRDDHEQLIQQALSNLDG